MWRKILRLFFGPMVDEWESWRPAKRWSVVLRQVLTQLFLLAVLLAVLFPVLWILSMALDPRDISKPQDLRLIPPGASLESFRRVLFDPYRLLCTNPSDDSTCMTFIHLFWNSLQVSMGTALFSVVTGASAAYAFSRFRFIGRQAGMLGFIILLMLPAVATMVPLFTLLNAIKIGREPLRTTLLGLAIAYASGALPFAIWNLKGYFDTISKDLEEAALIDGAGPLQAFVRVVIPLSAPALAITMLFSFMTGWSEFLMAWLFLENPQRFTLAMALQSMRGQFATPWSTFSAFSILMSIPIVVLFYILQRYIVSGLAVGGVKG
ncbi:MAG: ABC transporter permease subunit [Anaerolineae bacterium]|nr:ABC transporter permease subunit [Anaerolineae bacterium]